MQRKDLAGDVLVEVTEKELEQLRKDSAMLAALRAGGVDNWEWYSESLSEFFKEYCDDED